MRTYSYSRGKIDYRSKRMIIADLDGTLSEDREEIAAKTAELINTLLKNRSFAVITAARYARLNYQVVRVLSAAGGKKLFTKMYLLPQSATRMHIFAKGGWKRMYAENLSVAERARIKAALRECIRTLGYGSGKTYGKVVDDRISQISFAALGQRAPLELKRRWDPTGRKRARIARFLEELIPEFRIGIGGVSTVDITKRGRDKSYGIKMITKRLGYKKADMLYIGDRLMKGGNDYPVRAEGVDCIQVSGPSETNKVLNEIINS
ncbi:MAG TPA: HAD-IIB family hydrolase [Candidatus Baltobacteraceae bacterium]|nr:HAD-IIB family hydrolase [Candidatus Baltobacteraceae bacterium]HVC58428.1 HAD-IIB family hydrolase [Candidatus Acidoferrales bacterium]